MINILTVYNSYVLNGVSAVIFQYYNNIDKNKFRFHFVYSDQIVEKYQNALKSEVLIKIDGRNKNPIQYCNKLVEIIRKYKIDVIHVHGNSSTIFVELLAAKIAGVKIRIAHSHNTTCSHQVINRILRVPFNHSYTQAIGCGEEAGRWMFGKWDFVVLKNGIDLDHFKYDSKKRKRFREQLALEDKFLIGHVGRFTQQKNHKKIVDIFESFCVQRKDAYLILVGEGPLQKDTEQIVQMKGLQDRVVFYGTTNESDCVYSALDAFVFPSLYEGVPLTLIEAQASGLPCVISDKISPEVILTDLVEMVSLDTTEQWVDLLSAKHGDRLADSTKAIRLLTDNGFEIKEVIKKVESIYMGEPV